MGELVPAIILVGLGTILFSILRTFSDNSTRRKLAETRATLHRDLVNRFGSTEELLRYLGSDAGRAVFAPQPAEIPNPVKRILAGMQTGIVLAAVGIAFLGIRAAADVSHEGDTAFVFLGTMALSIGIAFLVSAGVAWALSKRWRLIERRAESDVA